MSLYFVAEIQARVPCFLNPTVVLLLLNPLAHLIGSIST